MTIRIKGLSVTPLSVISDEYGSVLHLLRSGDPAFLGFGECYCSETLPGAVKAWKRHNLQTQCLAVPIGCLRLVVFDNRPSSQTCGVINVIELGRPDSYARVIISPGLWYGFKAIGKSPALIVNCVNRPHHRQESDRLPAYSEVIPYRWDTLGDRC